MKFYQVSKEINGKEYTAQFNGIGAALDAVDMSYIDGTNTVSTRKISDYIFKHVIVVPRNLTADDFDTLEEFNEVVSFGREVMQGHFRDKVADEKSVKAKDKE